MIYFRHYLAKCAYNFIWIPWYLVLKIFAHYKVVYKDRSIRHIKGPILLIANHSSWIDPFLISGPFPMFSGIFPIHFAVWPKLFSVPGINIFVWVMGSFGVRRKVGLDQSLKTPLRFLENGWTVGVFPQGSRRKSIGRPKTGRRGAGYIALKKNPRIIPIFVDGAVGLTPASFFARKRHITVYAGKAFYLPSDMRTRRDAAETAAFMMQKLYNLQNDIIL